MTLRALGILLIVVAYAAVSGSFSWANLLFGFLIALAAAALVGTDRPTARPTRIRPIPALRLALLFVVELLKSGWRVARIAVAPELRMTPAVIAYPLRLRRDFDITILANLITLTPGTLSVDVSADNRLLYVHCLDGADEAAVIADIRDGFERRIMEAFP